MSNSKRKESQRGEEGGDTVTGTEFVIIIMNEGNLPLFNVCRSCPLVLLIKVRVR
jgi:hypothetical protein